MLKESYYRPAILAITNQDWKTAASLILQTEAIDRVADYRDLPERVRTTPALAAELLQQRSTLWQQGNVHLIETIPAGDFVNSIAFDPSGERLAVGTGARVGTLQLWRLTADLPRMQFWKSGLTSNNQPPVRRVGFSADGQFVAAWEYKTTTQLWPIDGRSPPLELVSGNGSFSPTEALFAGVNKAGGISVWSFADGVVQRTLQGISATVLDLGFSPDGHLLAACLADGTIAIWRREETQPVMVLDTPRSEDPYNLGTLAFSADGTLLAASVDSNSISIWNIADGRRVHLLSSQAPIESRLFGSCRESH